MGLPSVDIFLEFVGLPLVLLQFCFFLGLKVEQIFFIFIKGVPNLMEGVPIFFFFFKDKQIKNF